MKSTSPQAAETKRRILSVARELIQETGDFDLPMRKLASRAQVSLRTPYALFGSKTGLIGSILTEDQIKFREMTAKHEMIRYPIRTDRDDDALGPCVLAGPSCDSIDILYEKDPYLLPVTLEIGAKVLIEGTGAYTSTYSSVGFNGFAPLKSYVI